MRIPYFVFLLLGVWFTGGQVMAAEEGLVFDKIAIDSKWESTGELKSSLGLNVDGNWKWFISDIDLKFIFPNTETYYNGCNLDLIIPKVSNDLKLKVDYNWNQKYQSIMNGFEYRLQPSKIWDLSCGFYSGRKDPVPGYDSIYYYLQDRKQIGFNYHFNNFYYQLNYALIAKNYPEAKWYTSDRQTLNQRISWRPNNHCNYQLGYNEATGEYPHDLSYTRSFWKANWVLSGEQKFNEDFCWNWICSQTNWDQGYRIKRSAEALQMSFELFLNPLSSIQTEFSLAKKIYSDNIKYDPDETEDPEEELASRYERKLIIGYNYRYKKVSMGLGVFIAALDYYSSPDIFKTGFFGSWRFQTGNWKISFKAAPEGNLSRNTGYYQLRVDYDLNFEPVGIK